MENKPEIHTEEPTQSNDLVRDLLEKVESLEKDRAKDQEKLSMLEAVADKGKVFNYRNKQPSKKTTTVKLSIHNGKTLVGWRTIKDLLVKNPTTGLTVGEEQEYELILQDSEGNISKETVKSYQGFSDVRYGNQVEAEVVGKREDQEGRFTYDLLLPDGQEISLDERFLN